MHMFDLARRFMGGYGIVGGNLPIAAGIALASDYCGTDEVTLCTFGDGASNQGTFGETLNLAALWRLPVVFMVTNNQFGMGTALGRHSAVTDLQRKGESLGVPGMRCDGMDVSTPTRSCAEAVRARARGAPAAAGRGRHLPLPRPLDGRPRAVPHARRRWRTGASATRSASFGERLVAEGVIDEQRARERSTQQAIARVDAAVAFADASPFPAPESLYDDVYVLAARCGGLVLGGDERGLQPRAGTARLARWPAGEPAPAANDEIPQQLTEALAAGEDGRRDRRRRPADGASCATARRSGRRCARSCAATSG